MMKRCRRCAFAITILAMAFYVGGSWIFAQRLTRARPAPIARLNDFPYPVEAVSISTTDGETVAGWLLEADDRKKTIVLLHGYTGNRQQMTPRARWLRSQGYSVLLYDARACGESTGDCTTIGFRESADLRAAIAYLNQRGHDNIACLGVSQGGATILFAAAELPNVKCIVCESVYDEMSHAIDRRMRRYTRLPGWPAASLMVYFAERRLELSVSDVRPVAYVNKLRCPIFIVSGDQDDRTWPEDTRRLFAAAPEPKELWMIEGARHEDLFRHAGYQEKVGSFLKRHLE